MFCGCSLLKELNLSNFDTSNVRLMSWMFSRCTSLKKLNLLNFNTNKLYDLSYMFNYCSSELTIICKDKIIKNIYK